MKFAEMGVPFIDLVTSVPITHTAGAGKASGASHEYDDINLGTNQFEFPMPIVDLTWSSPYQYGHGSIQLPGMMSENCVT